MLRLRDVMTTDLVVATPEMTLREAIDLLWERHVSGAPVIAGRKIVGIITASDLLGFAADNEEARETVGLTRRVKRPLDQFSVGDVMTRRVLSLESDASVEESAELMRKFRIHRILVTKDGELAGIVSTTDIADAVADRKLQKRTYTFGKPQHFDPRSWMSDETIPAPEKATS